jgi:hypothetical protein
MDIEALVGMAFAFLMTLTLAVTFGTVILLKPLMRNLGNFLEAKAEERKGLGGRSQEEWDRLFAGIEGLGNRLEALEERQDFTERLLAEPRPGGKEGP